MNNNNTLYQPFSIFKRNLLSHWPFFSQPGYHGEWIYSSEQVLSHTPLAFTVIYCLHILQYLTVQWCEEVFAPFLIYFFGGYLSYFSDHQTHLHIRKR